MTSTSKLYQIKYDDEYCLQSQEKEPDETNPKDRHLEWKACEDKDETQLFSIKKNDTTGTITQKIKNRTYTIASHAAGNGKFSVHMNYNKKKSGENIVWEINNKCEGDKKKYSYIKSLGTSSGWADATASNDRCVTKGDDEVPILTGGECKCADIPAITFEEVEDDSGSVSDGDGDGDGDGDETEEKELPFFAQKAGPLEWGWWIIIIAGVLCIFGMIGAFLLASSGSSSRY